MLLNHRTLAWRFEKDVHCMMDGDAVFPATNGLCTIRKVGGSGLTPKKWSRLAP